MIDVTFDFTTDTPGFWDGYWEGNDGLGYGKADPDNASPTLQKYHQMLWSRELPAFCMRPSLWFVARFI